MNSYIRHFHSSCSFSDVAAILLITTNTEATDIKQPRKERTSLDRKWGSRTQYLSPIAAVWLLCRISHKTCCLLTIAQSEGLIPSPNCHTRCSEQPSLCHSSRSLHPTHFPFQSFRCYGYSIIWLCVFLLEEVVIHSQLFGQSKGGSMWAVCRYSITRNQKIGTPDYESIQQHSRITHESGHQYRGIKAQLSSAEEAFSFITRYISSRRLDMLPVHGGS